MIRGKKRMGDQDSTRRRKKGMERKMREREREKKGTERKMREREREG